MKYEEYIVDGVTYCRISKTEARKIYNQGRNVYLCPVHMRLDSPWNGLPYINNKEDMRATFNDRICQYEIYNCDGERGQYLKYFKEWDN